MSAFARWTPAGILVAGVLAVRSISLLPSQPLRAPLTQALPREVLGWSNHDIAMPDAQRVYAGVASYVNRVYAPAPAGDRWASVYVGYYDRQANGTTIHSPKNCLPGAGWEELESGTIEIATPAGPATVNRYLVRRGSQRALVLYWYQGRGRIQANEYVVKWNLLRDAVVRRRSEEALVRVVVPIGDSPTAALETARSLAELVILRVSAALPV